MVADTATGALTRTASTSTVGKTLGSGQWMKLFKDRDTGDRLVEGLFMRLSTGLVLLRTWQPELRSLLMNKSAWLVIS